MAYAQWIRFNAFKASLPICNLILGLILLSCFSAWGQTNEQFDTPGIFSWTCPAGVTSITVECWGGGGAGGTGTIATTTTSRSGGGGSGGSYVKKIFTVVTGTMYTIIVGAGGTTNAMTLATSHGNSGGKSEFSGSGITTLTASGGTGGGGTAFTKPTGTGGTLGGVYGYQLISQGSKYASPTAAVGAPLSGTAATAVVGLSGNAVFFVVSNTQGTGYTTAPTVTITGGSGTGAAATALINPNINAGGTTMTTGVNGTAAAAASGGAGGAAGGLAFGGGTGAPTNSTANSAGSTGVAPGGGGSGGYVMNSITGRFGGVGAAGRVKLTYTIILPIELTFFKAKRNQSYNLLTWATASEKNNAFFDIQRSTNGVDFQNISQVKGNNKPSTYQYIDNQPFAISYYRLRQIDFDGKETLSKVISIATKGNSTLKVYPNPVSNTLTIELDSALWELGAGNFQILNLLGQQVLTGKTAQRIDVSALPQGSYVLKVGAEKVKFVKQ